MVLILVCFFVINALVPIINLGHFHLLHSSKNGAEPNGYLPSFFFFCVCDGNSGEYTRSFRGLHVWVPEGYCFPCAQRIIWTHNNIYIYIYIYVCVCVYIYIYIYHQILLVARSQSILPLSTRPYRSSLLAGLLDCIHCLNKPDLCRVSACQPTMWGSPLDNVHREFVFTLPAFTCLPCLSYLDRLRDESEVAVEVLFCWLFV